MGNVMSGITSGIGLGLGMEAVRGIGNAISGSTSDNVSNEIPHVQKPDQTDICNIFSQKFTECMAKNNGEDCIVYLNNYNLCKQNMF